MYDKICDDRSHIFSHRGANAKPLSRPAPLYLALFPRLPISLVIRAVPATPGSDALKNSGGTWPVQSVRRAPQTLQTSRSD